MSTKYAIPTTIPPGSAPVALGHLNITYGTYFRPGELAATERSAAMLREGSIVPVWSGPVAALYERAVTRTSALEAIAHVEQYNGPGRASEAAEMLFTLDGIKARADALTTDVFAIPRDLVLGTRRVPHLPTPKQLREAMRAMPVPDAELAKAIYLAMTSPEALKEEVLAPRVPG